MDIRSSVSTVIPSITFLGGGNMANALVSGLISHGHTPSSIHVVDRHAEKRDALVQQYGIQASDDYALAIAHADMVIFSIKPQGFSALIAEVAPLIQTRNPLIVSIMSGLRLETLQAALPSSRIIRAMPNTPSRVQAGMTLLTSDHSVNKEALAQVQQLFNAVGKTFVTPNERVFEQLTALTGCGPAFVFYLVDMFAKAMQEITVDVDCLPLALATFQGALTLMQTEENIAAEALIAQVSPKGGMTAEAMKILEAAHVQHLLQATFKAAIDRGDELAGR